MKKPIPSRSQGRQPSSPDVELQRVVNQPGLCEPAVPLIPPAHKLLLRDALLEVLVGPVLLADRHGRHRLAASALAAGGIVVAGPDLVFLGQVKQLIAHRGVQGLGIAAGEVAARRADIVVEERVAAKDVG
jgi:hypothetical protein